MILFRGQEHCHAPSFHSGGYIRLGDVLYLQQNPVQHLLSKFRVGDLPTAEEDGDLYPLSPLDKSANVANLMDKVVGICPRPHLDLFDGYRGMLFPPRSSLILLFLEVTELSIIHDAADWWLSFGGHLDQIEIIALHQTEGLPQRHDAQLISLRTNDPDLMGPDLMINSCLLCYKPPPFSISYQAGFQL